MIRLKVIPTVVLHRALLLKMFPKTGTVRFAVYVKKILNQWNESIKLV